MKSFIRVHLDPRKNAVEDVKAILQKVEKLSNPWDKGFCIQVIDIIVDWRDLTEADLGEATWKEIQRLKRWFVENPRIGPRPMAA